MILIAFYYAVDIMIPHADKNKNNIALTDCLSN